MQGHSSFLEHNKDGYWHTRMTKETKQIAIEPTGGKKNI